MTPFILFPQRYGLAHRDVQTVTQSGRVAHPPPVDRPLVGTITKEEIQMEEDDILHQLRTTQRYGPAHIDVQIVTQSGRVAYHLPIDRPLASTITREEIQIEDDEILY